MSVFFTASLQTLCFAYQQQRSCSDKIVTPAHLRLPCVGTQPRLLLGSRELAPPKLSCRIGCCLVARRPCSAAQMNTLSPHEQKLHRSLLIELTKDEIGNKVGLTSAFCFDRSRLCIRFSFADAQVKLGPRAPAKLRSLVLDTHDTLPATRKPTVRKAPHASRATQQQQVQHLQTCSAVRL